MTDVPAEPPRRRWRWLLYAAPALVLILISLANAGEASESGAETAGQILGALTLPLGLALLLRLAYVKVLARSQRRPFWSPWIFAIAAFLALVVAFARVATREADPERQEARSLVEDASGSQSEDVVDCVEGALDSIANRGATPLPLTPAQTKLVMVRFCQEAERRGFERRGRVPTPRELVPLVQEVVAEMRARGELPPA